MAWNSLLFFIYELLYAAGINPLPWKKTTGNMGKGGPLVTHAVYFC